MGIQIKNSKNEEPLTESISATTISTGDAAPYPRSHGLPCGHRLQLNAMADILTT